VSDDDQLLRISIHHGNRSSSGPGKERSATGIDDRSRDGNLFYLSLGRAYMRLSAVHAKKGSSSLR
jgi:hypothetical protein